MPKVIGTKGNLITYEVSGIAQTMARLRYIGQEVENIVDLEVIKLGTYMGEEVQMSVAGKRDEIRSVLTGHFIRDVRMDKLGTAVVKVHAPNTPYAKYLERRRGHFEQSLRRNEDFIRRRIRNAITKMTMKENLKTKLR